MEYIKNNFKNCDKIINNIRKSFDNLVINNIDDGVNAIEQYLSVLKNLQNDILDNNLVLLLNKTQDLITHLELVLQSYIRQKQAHKIKCENSALIYYIIVNKYSKNITNLELNYQSKLYEQKLYNKNGFELDIFKRANKILRRYINIYKIKIGYCKVLGQKFFLKPLDK